MKRFLSILLVVCMLFSLYACADLAENENTKNETIDKMDQIIESGKLVVGAEVRFAPYEFYYKDPETGEETLAGFEMKIAQGLADELNVELEISDQAFSGLITALRSDEIDLLISGLGITEERKEAIDISDPYFYGNQILLVRSEDVDKFQSPNDLAGRPIAAKTGSIHQGIAEEQFPDAELILLDQTGLLVTELRQGTVDGVLVTDNAVLAYLLLYPELAISPIHVEYPVLGVGIGIKKGDNEKLVQFINEYLQKIQEDGTLEAWIDEAVEQNAKMLDATE